VTKLEELKSALDVAAYDAYDYGDDAALTAYAAARAAYDAAKAHQAELDKEK